MAASNPHVYEEHLLLNSNTAPGGVIVYYADGDEEIIHVNQYVIDLCECDSVEDFLAFTHGSFKGFVHAEDIDAAEESIWSQVGSDSDSKLDQIYYRVSAKSGRSIMVEDFGRLVEEPGKRPVFHAFLFELGRSGSIDWLTGLPSMTRFHKLARMGVDAMRARGEQPVAIALDIIGLKAFNTQYGRSEGDRLLCAFADVLRKQFSSEMCSRFAEDHFYAFAPKTVVVERINAVFEGFAKANGGRVLPVRAGAYVCDPDDDIVAVGFDRAKIACDLDRKTWRSHFLWFTDRMRDAEEIRVHVLDHVDEAIAKGWVRPFYQGVVRASTSEICGEEALARWIDPIYGQLSPAQFVPVLEETGLLYKIDLHIIDCVINDMRVKQENGVRVVPVSVNVSLRDLDQFDLVGELLRRADAVGVPHELVRVEFTESVAMANSNQFMRTVAALRAAGFRVWMDDFGSGYSSLNMLQDFDFDLIKLDMEFVRGSESEKARIIMAGVIESAKRLGVGTLAEGVETERQAEFLESVGCDMLQGFYFAKPRPLEEILRDVREGVALARELQSENAYWRAVSGLDLDEPTGGVNGQSFEEAPQAEFPTGIIECRKGVWQLVRANEEYREFLHNVGMVPRECSNLTAIPVQNMDDEFVIAAQKSLLSSGWVRIGSHIEYGTGYQFYLRHVASAQDSEAYLVFAVPTMLGTALGTYGDVPVAYAIFRVKLSPAGDEIVDAEYVYANQLYCEWGGHGYSQEALIGRSFLETFKSVNTAWFSYCYRAVVHGEKIHDVVYSPEAGHWLSFNLSPSPVEGCCVYAFTIADDERFEREQMIVGLDTSDIIISMADALNDEVSYEVAMNQLLEHMSRFVHPERLYVFERDGETTSNTFEWCAPGVEPQIDTLQNLDNSEFDTWNKLLANDSAVIIPNVEEFKGVDDRMYLQLTRQGIKRVLAVPFRGGGELLGYLGADNYELDEGLDTRRLLETVASFVGSRIANHRLMERIAWAGTHDALTGMFNRMGIDYAIRNHMDVHGDEPFSLVLMDVDDFKRLNDVYGHNVGDEALRELARRIWSVFPKSAIVGRNGGDEFLVMLFGDEAEAMEDLLHRFYAHGFSCTCEGVEYPLTVSAGYTRYPQIASGLGMAYTQADAVLYAVKLAGKCEYRVYTTEMQTQYRSQLGFTPRDIAENIPGAIVVHEPGDGRILFANDEVINLFECDDLSDFMEYTGGTFGGLVHPEDRDRVRDELGEQTSLEDVGVKDFVDYRIVTKRGNVRRVANNGRLVNINGVGLVCYELIINRDERGVR